MSALVVVVLVAVPPLGFSLAIDPLVQRQRRADARVLALADELRWLWSRRPPWPEVRRELALVSAVYSPLVARWCAPPLLRLVSFEAAAVALLRLGPVIPGRSGAALLTEVRLARPAVSAGLLLVALAVFAASAAVVRRWRHPPPAGLLSLRTVFAPPLLAVVCWHLPVLLALWIVVASALHAGRVARLAAGGDRWDPDQAPGLGEARALRRRLEAATPEQRAASAPSVRWQAVWLLALQPAQGLELYSTLAGLDPEAAGGRLRAAALRAQVRGLPGTLERDWPVVERRLADALQERPAEVLGVLDHALRLVPPSVPSRGFRRRATRLLLAHLDLVVRLSARPPGWTAVEDTRRLPLVILARADTPPPMARGQLWCILGDLAVSRDGRRREAALRYRAALRQGYAPARDRLAVCLAAEGRAWLGRGHVRVARRRLAAARRLRDDPCYRLLETVSWIVARARTASDSKLLADLEALGRDGVEPATIGFWTAALHLLRARPEAALAALAEHPRRELGDAPSWDAADQLALLRAALEDDEPVLAAAARTLAAGATWRQQGPVAPAPMLAVAARQDRDLVVDLARTAGTPAALPGWARLIGAHGAMERTLRLVEERSPLEAKESFDLARRLLGRRLA